MSWTLIEYDEVGSTLDVAHTLAADGAAAGTVVIADAQTAGRGQRGRAWQSERGAGLWLTLIERPSDASALDVLSLRVGLALAPALDPNAPDDFFLFVGSDNDFITQHGMMAGKPYADGSGANVDSLVLVYRVTLGQ